MGYDSGSTMVVSWNKVLLVCDLGLAECDMKVVNDQGQNIYTPKFQHYKKYAFHIMELKPYEIDN